MTNVSDLFTYNSQLGRLMIKTPRDRKIFGSWGKKNFGRVFSYIDARTPIDVYGEQWRIVDIIWFLKYGRKPTGIRFLDGDPFNFKFANLQEIPFEEPYKIKKNNKFHQRFDGGIAAKYNGEFIGAFDTIGKVRAAIERYRKEHEW